MNSERKTATDNSALRKLISELEVDAVGIASLAEWKGTRLEEVALRLLPETRSVVCTQRSTERQGANAISASVIPDHAT